MDYETGKTLETHDAEIEILTRVCKKLNDLVVVGGGSDVFALVREEMENEATKGEGEVEPQKKKGRVKSPLV